MLFSSFEIEFAQWGCSCLLLKGIKLWFDYFHVKTLGKMSAFLQKQLLYFIFSVKFLTKTDWKYVSVNQCMTRGRTGLLGEYTLVLLRLLDLSLAWTSLCSFHDAVLTMSKTKNHACNIPTRRVEQPVGKRIRVVVYILTPISDFRLQCSL